MFMQVTETARLAQLIADERGHTNPVSDIEPFYAVVETRKISVVSLAVAIRAAVSKVSNLWAPLSRWFRPSLQEQSV